MNLLMCFLKYKFTSISLNICIYIFQDKHNVYNIMYTTIMVQNQCL